MIFGLSIWILVIKLTATNDLTQPPKMTSEMIKSAWANKGFFLYQLDPDKVSEMTNVFTKRFLKKIVLFNQTCLDIILVWVGVRV